MLDAHWYANDINTCIVLFFFPSLFLYELIQHEWQSFQRSQLCQLHTIVGIVLRLHSHFLSSPLETPEHNSQELLHLRLYGSTESSLPWLSVPATIFNELESHGCESKCKAPIHTLNPQADPYPRSIPKRRWSRPIHTSGSLRADPYPNFDATPHCQTGMELRWISQRNMNNNFQNPQRKSPASGWT